MAWTCGAVVAACSAQSPGGAASATHQLRSDQLREVMRGFDSGVRKDVPAEVDQHDRWEGVFPKIADAAEQLAASARNLSRQYPKGLDMPERGRFEVLARDLETAASELKEAAARGDADSVETARKSVGEACSSCHERFRPDYPGVPEAFR